MKIDIEKLRSVEPAIVCIGSHPGIIQSILDFDFLQGRERPSIRCIVASGRRSERFFWQQRGATARVWILQTYPKCLDP